VFCGHRYCGLGWVFWTGEISRPQPHRLSSLDPKSAQGCGSEQIHRDLRHTPNPKLHDKGVAQSRFIGIFAISIPLYPKP
jgi:hypothetical protein